MPEFDANNQPKERKPRGRSNKSKVLEGIMEALPNCETKEEAEAAYFKHVALRAFDLEDKDSPTLLKLLGDKGWGSAKPSLDCVSFDFPMDGTPAQRAFAVIEAISNETLAPDIGVMIVGIVKDAIIIEESTDLKERINAIEKALGVENV
jgi:hypothetical protein